STSRSGSRATKSTRAPSAHRRRTVARPIPLLAPVTTQTLSSNPSSMAPSSCLMRSHTDYLTFQTTERREFVRITDDVQQLVERSGVREGMVLVSAMHITAGVWVNDDEPGIHADAL